MALSRPQKSGSFTDAVIDKSLTVDQNTLVVDDTNSRVGIGTTTPSAQLEVQDTTTSSANTGGVLRLSANDGSPMGDSHRLGVLEFSGAEDSSNTQVVGARIEALTDAAWTNVENGCALYFYTTDANAAQSNVLKIDSNKKSTFNGKINITDATDATDGDAALFVTGGATITKKLIVGNNLTVDGDLTVNGTTTTINSTTLTVDDKNIVVASGAADSAAADGAGLTVDGANATFTYTHSGTKWNMNKPLDITGALTTSGVVDITDATDATDASGDTGALRTEGGASIAKKLFVGTDLDVDGTTNLDAVDIDGAVQIDGTVNVGVGTGTGYDVIFFGDTAGSMMLWDASGDDLILIGASRAIVPDGQLVLGTTAVTSTAAELNLLDGVSGLVQEDFTKLAAVDSTAAELNLLDGSAKSTSSITIDDSDAFLIIDGTTTKQIPASDLKTYASGSGASALNDLSDASFSSGDLTVTGLDLLTTSATAHDTVGTAVVMQGGSTTAGTTDNIAGGNLVLKGGAGKGTGAGGSIEFQTIPAGSSGNALNTTTVTPLTISTTEVVVNDGSEEHVDFRVESNDKTHFMFMDSGNNRISIGSSTDTPEAVMEIEDTSSGDSIPILKLRNVRNTANTLEIDGNNTCTTGTLLDVKAGALTTGRAARFLNSNNHDGTRDVVLIEQSNANSDNATALRVKQDGPSPAISMEFDGVATDKAPILEFIRSSTSSEANGMHLGTMNFVGSDSANNLDTYVQFFVDVKDKTSDSEVGRLTLNTLYGSSTLVKSFDIQGRNVTFGSDGDAEIISGDTAHNVAGKNMIISAGSTTAGTTDNIQGGDLELKAGQGKGNETGGKIKLKVGPAGASGNALNALETMLTINPERKIEIGSGVAADIMLTFDGNAQDYRLGIDDGTDTLELGHGTTMGTNTALSVNSSGQVASLNVPAATVAVGSDHIMFFDGGATGAPKSESITDFAAALVGAGLTSSSGVIANGSTSSVLIDDNTTLTANNTGNAVFVKEVSGTKTITLPTPTAGFSVKIVFLNNNTASNIIKIQAAADTTYLYGLISRIDVGGTASGYHTSPSNSYAGATASTYVGGASAETFNTITLTNNLAGTVIELFSDGTRWHLWGHMTSSFGGSDATAVFSTEDY